MPSTSNPGSADDPLALPEAQGDATAARIPPPPAGRTPLQPERVGREAGQAPNTELDIAPNLGGENQMQDA